MCVDIVLTFYRLGERLDIVQENPWPRAEGCPHKLSDPPSQWATTTGAQPRQHHPDVWPQGVSHSQHNVKLYFSLVIWSHVFFSKWGFEECIFYDSNRKLYTWIYLYMNQGASNSQQYAQLYHPPLYFDIVGFSFLFYCFVINDTVTDVYDSNSKLIVGKIVHILFSLYFKIHKAIHLSLLQIQ